MGEEWCVGGNFNTLMFKEERITKSVRSSGKDSTYFYNIVEEIELIDLPCLGGDLTSLVGMVVL